MADRPPLPAAGWLVFRRELRAHRRTFLLWLVPIAGLLLLNLAMQPSMAGDGGVLAAKLEAMPPALMRAFGISLLDVTRPAPYLAMNFIYVTLTASLLAGMLGATLVAKEEAQHTAELLLTGPVGRGAVLAGKAGALAVYGLGYNVALALVAIAASAAIIAGPVEPGRIASLFAGTAALAACFGGLGMLIATVVPTPRHAGNAALGVVLGTFLVSAVAAAIPQAEVLHRLSPFRAVEPGRIVLAGGPPVAALLVLGAVGVAAGLLAVRRYQRRDIHA
jgi:ABC-2 type transport system permease protein